MCLINYLKLNCSELYIYEYVSLSVHDIVYLLFTEADRTMRARNTNMAI